MEDGVTVAVGTLKGMSHGCAILRVASMVHAVHCGRACVPAQRVYLVLLQDPFYSMICAKHRHPNLR